MAGKSSVFILQPTARLTLSDDKTKPVKIIIARWQFAFSAFLMLPECWQEEDNGLFFAEIEDQRSDRITKVEMLITKDKITVTFYEGSKICSVNEFHWIVDNDITETGGHVAISNLQGEDLIDLALEILNEVAEYIR